MIRASQGGYELTFTQEAASGNGVDPRAESATAGGLRHVFSIRIRGDADPQQTAHAISESLVQTFLSGAWYARSADEERKKGDDPR